MNLQAGANVGFATVVGGLGGLVFGAMITGLLDLKRPGEIMAGLGATGGLLGAVIGGTLIAPDPTTTPSTTGAAGPPRVVSPPIVQLKR
jgi:hypothetical protein